jgi:hypothetical protein
MSTYGRELYDDVVQVQHEEPDSFGSGRLVGRNLVLTARHVVQPDSVIVDSGWKIRRIGDRPKDWLNDPSKVMPKSAWIWRDAEVAYVSDVHDLAVVRILEPAEMIPCFRTRVATVRSAEEEN